MDYGLRIGGAAQNYPKADAAMDDRSRTSDDELDRTIDLDAVEDALGEEAETCVEWSRRATDIVEDPLENAWLDDCVVGE